MCHVRDQRKTRLHGSDDGARCNREVKLSIKTPLTKDQVTSSFSPPPYRLSQVFSLKAHVSHRGLLALAHICPPYPSSRVFTHNRPAPPCPPTFLLPGVYPNAELTSNLIATLTFFFFFFFFPRPRDGIFELRGRLQIKERYSPVAL